MSKLFCIIISVVLMGAAANLSAWSMAHKWITKDAIKTLPQWQKDFLGNEKKPLANRYCFYPDWHNGKTRKETTQYIMPVLKTGRTNDEIPLHVMATDRINTRLYRFYIYKIISLMKNRKTRVEGIRFMGTFFHALEDRGAPAHSFAQDLLFEKMKEFRPPPAGGKFIMIHGKLEDLNVEYTGLSNYKPKLMATTPNELLWVLRKRIYDLNTEARSYVLPILREVYQGHKLKSRSIQNEIALKNTELIADFMYTCISIASERFDCDREQLAKISAIAHSCEKTDLSRPSIKKIASEYKRLFSWGESYADLVAKAFALIPPEASQVLSASQKKTIGQYAVDLENSDLRFLPEMKDCKAAFELDGNAIHMFSEPHWDRDIFKFIIKKAIDSIRGNNFQKAKKYLSLIAHVISDRNSPADMYTKDFYCYYFRDFLPAPKGKKNFWKTNSALFEYRTPMKQITNKPKLLGESAKEISFQIFNRLRTNSRLIARRSYIDLISALFADDTITANRVRHMMAANAVRDIADVYYSILIASIGNTKKQETPYSFVRVPEAPPPLNPKKSWGDNLFQHYLRHHWHLMPYCGIMFKNISGGYNHPPTPQKPLMLNVDGKHTPFTVGFSQSYDYGHTFLIPAGVYSTFKAQVGPHALLSGKATYHFAVDLDGKEVFKSQLMLKDSQCETISIPLKNAKEVRLRLIKVKGSAKKIHAVWANPVLLK